MALIKLAGTVNDSIVDGEGYRFTIFTQGCPHNCIGCHNPQTHDFAGGYEDDTDQLLADVELHQHNLDVWCYTGYTMERLLNGTPEQVELLREVDVLVDGPYEEWKRDISLSFRGSSNQRVIDVQESLKQNQIILYDL